MKILSGHQPTYLPWLGFFHKISLCDVFVLMDDVDYVAQDWINRNRIKSAQSEPIWLSVPVDLKNSPSQKIKDIRIKGEPGGDRKKWWYRHWMGLKASYGKSEYFNQYKDFFEDCFMARQWENLCELNVYLIKNLTHFFGIDVEMKLASDYEFIKNKSDLLKEHCQTFNAEVLVTGTHAVDYLQHDDFLQNGIFVYHQDYAHPTYPQRFRNFLPNLSCVDLLFNCGSEAGAIVAESNESKESLMRKAQDNGA